MESFGILYVWKEPVLTAGQLSRLSNIADNAGNVFFAIGVLTPMFSVVDKPNVVVILSGVVGTIIFWSVSVVLARRGESL